MPTYFPRPKKLISISTPTTKGKGYAQEWYEAPTNPRKAGDRQADLFPKEMSLSAHLKKWSTCSLCPLHETTSHHVLYRGPESPIALFIGEGPGWTEDLLGKPFIGPAGHLLKKAINHERIYNLLHIVTNRLEPDPNYGITNIIACTPWKTVPEDRGVRPPSKVEAHACRPRLEELLRITKPPLVVLLGAVAKSFFPKIPKRSPYQPKIIYLEHPSSILRKYDDPEDSIAFRKFVLKLQEALETL